MCPDAPSPSKPSIVKSRHATPGSVAGACVLHPRGLPARANQLRRGNCNNQSGSIARSLAARRSSSRPVAWQRLSGSAERRLPASINFCSAGRSPTACGNVHTSLSVRISQRRWGGSAAYGTSAMRQALKPSTWSCAHAPSTSGTWVKGLLEQKMTLSLCRRGKSWGRSRNWLPERLSTSRVSAKANTSSGNVCSPQDKSRRFIPTKAPLRNCSNVCKRSVPCYDQTNEIVKVPCARYRARAQVMTYLTLELWQLCPS